MATQSISEFQQAARQRWPDYIVEGDGPFALICPASYAVDLFPFAMMAMAQIALNHSNRNCKDGHSLIELKPAAPRKPFRNRFDLERD